MRFPTLAVLALASLATTAAAQVQAMNNTDTGRKNSICILFEPGGEHNFNPKGAVAINYSQPDWKDEYTKALDSGKYNNSNLRLGKNWWTSFDTTLPLEIGGTKIAPGAYYLGLHIDEAGKPQLMFIDAMAANKSGWAPYFSTPWKAEFTAPLTLAKNSLKETVNQMEITITANQNPSTGRFSIKWGKHELSADVKFQIENTKDASAPKK
jgi:hypothetical protein